MAVETVTMQVRDKMKEEMLNNWSDKTNYGVILTQVDGQSNPGIGDSQPLEFGEPTSTTGGLKTTHEKTTDLIVGSNENVVVFRITRDNLDPETVPHATVNIGQTYEHGGVFRINKIEITLT